MSLSNSERTDTQFISEHCHAYRINDGKILVVELHNSDRETVEAWMEFSALIRRTWDEDYPLYILIDMSQIDFSFGMFARRKAADMLKINAHIPTYISWITQDTVMGNLMRTTLEYTNVVSRTIKFGLFFDHEQALEWLYKHGAPRSDSNGTEAEVAGTN